VWNDNISFDELIGTSLIRLPRERTMLGDAVWFPINTGASSPSPPVSPPPCRPPRLLLLPKLRARLPNRC